MAELTVFSFHPKTTFLHRLDVRFKFIFLTVFSLSSLKAASGGLLILSAVLTGSLVICRISLLSLLKEMRYFIILLFFVFIARALATPGTVFIQYHFIRLSQEGMWAGLFVCWRLITVVLLGLTFVVTSRPSEIRAAVQWFLGPFPFIHPKRVATMIALVMRFVPVIFNQIRETTEAQRARGIENKKNPIYRIKSLSIPLIWRTFNHADQLVDAMEARCYTDNRTGPKLYFRHSDWMALAGGVGLSLLIIYL